MKELLPIICRGTPGAACGAPAIIAATSLLDLPQKEQRNVRAFIRAIMTAISTSQPTFQRLLHQAVLSVIRDAR